MPHITPFCLLFAPPRLKGYTTPLRDSCTISCTRRLCCWQSTCQAWTLLLGHELESGETKRRCSSRSTCTTAPSRAQHVIQCAEVISPNPMFNLMVVLHLVSHINGSCRDGCTSSLMQQIQVNLHVQLYNTLRHLDALSATVARKWSCTEPIRKLPTTALQLYTQCQVMPRKLSGFALPVPVAAMRP